ncbi:MAG: peptidase M14 [Ignavibacteriales bacterium]|nr:peptidase M14 [Ignavibacteriales bacterium]
MNNEIIDFSKRLFDKYDQHRIDDFKNRSFGYEILSVAISKIAANSKNLLNVYEAGRSFENRKINLVTVGGGKIDILLWSQMHGDESTATMAICDILNYISTNRDEEKVKAILNSVKLNFLPMLNPDGAERFQRRTSQMIDLNRDAKSLRTPEAVLLKSIRNKIRPSFGFNLHDQELSSVGYKKELSAIGLLAPAFDAQKSDNQIRMKAKHLASVFASTMKQFISGKVTKYDDSFEPRAFGDNMQLWGTSTLLVESGHVQDDLQKDFIRKLNFVGILSSIFAIATDALEEFDLKEYEELPFNGKKAYDLIIRNILIESKNGIKTEAELGISSQVDTHSEPPPKLVDVGDLSLFIGLAEIDGRGKCIPLDDLKLNNRFETEKYF